MSMLLARMISSAGAIAKRYFASTLAASCWKRRYGPLQVRRHDSVRRITRSEIGELWDHEIVVSDVIRARAILEAGESAAVTDADLIVTYAIENNRQRECIRSLEARIAALEEALRPFAAVTFTRQDVTCARALLEAKEAQA